MAYGLTSAGFNKKDFDIILAEKKEQVNNAIGPIILEPKDVVTVLISTEAEREALVWETAEATVNSFYRATATGTSLDGVSANIGLTRLGATPTTVQAVVTGENQTVIPAGNEVSALGVNTTFVLNNDVLITNSSCNHAHISINDINIDEFSLSINATIISYTKQDGDTADDIIDGLAQIINNDLPNINAGKEEIDQENVLYLSVDEDENDTFSVAVDIGLAIKDLSTTAQFTAATKGAISVPALSLTIIQTPIAGWLSVINFEAGITGRNLETDVEFRARGDLSLSLPGSATLAAVRARVLNVQGVTSAEIDENDTLVTNANGTPAKSFQILVVGGDDLAIAQSIYDSKPAGISAFGNTYITIENFEITPVMIGFSRPVPLYIFVKVTYTLTANSNFPIDGEEQITNNIAKKINALGIGKDVILQNLYCSIFDVSGISNATIQLGSSLNPDDNAVVYGNNNITVNASQVATTDINKIDVSEV